MEMKVKSMVNGQNWCARGVPRGRGIYRSGTGVESVGAGDQCEQRGKRTSLVSKAREPDRHQRCGPPSQQVLYGV